MATLTCKDCGHVNEGERVYCHNCGTKLDRSILPVDEKETETPAKARKRVLKMTNPRLGLLRGIVKPLLSALLWAAMIAAMIQIARPPDGVPSPPKKDELAGEAPPIAMVLEDAALKPVSQRIGIPQEAANAYLQQHIGAKKSEGSKTVRFVRAFVNFSDGACAVTTEQALFDFSLYATAVYQLAIKENKVDAKNIGGSLGRLPIHPLIMRYSDAVFGKVWNALNREHKLMDGMQSIEVAKDKLTVVTKPRSGRP